METIREGISNDPWITHPLRFSGGFAKIASELRKRVRNVSSMTAGPPILLDR